MNLPEVIVEVGLTGPEISTDIFVLDDPVRGLLDTGLLAGPGDEVWTDISPWVREWSVTRGSKRGDDPTLRYDTGTLTVVLNDGDRRFDPDNLDGPYVLGGETLLTPMRRIRIRAVWDGVTYPIIAAFTDDWVADYQGNDWTYTTVTASDALAYFAGIDRMAISPVGAGEDAGARVSRILDSIAWPAADRSIATGDTTLQATTLADNALTELLLVQDTELGEFYVDATGKAVFRNRRAMILESRSAAVQAVFGDGGFEADTVHDFEIGVGDWTGFGATVSASSVVVHGGTTALVIEVVGTPTQAYARPTYGSQATGGTSYTATAWVYHPAGGPVGLAIDWFTSAGAYISTSFASGSAAVADWTLLSVTGTAPATAARATYGPSLTGSPATGTRLYFDDVVFSPDAVEIPYAVARPSSLVEALANTVTAANAGGTEQVAQDVDSVSQFLVRTHRRLDLLGETDDQALEWANAVMYQYSKPRRRWESLSFNTPSPQVEHAHWPAVLGREFGDRITVIRRPAGGGDPIVRDCFVRGVTHQSDGESWTTSWVLQSADRYSFFVLDDPILGRLDFNALAP